MYARFFLLSLLLFLAACSSASQNAGGKPKANMEPEISGLEALKSSRGRPLTPAERQALDSKAGIAFRLSPEETEEVKLFFQYFTRDKRDTVQRWLLRSEPHLEYVRAVLASHRLPQDILALPYIESGYNVLAVSSSGAVGMWQFMPVTARRFGLTVDWWLDERRDPYLSTVAAARYLKILHEQFGDWQLALAAYNAGEGSVSRAMTKSGTQSFRALAKSSAPIKDETRHYVPKFLAMLKIVQNSKKLGFDAPDMRASKDLQEVRIPASSDLAGLADHLGLSWEQFHALNPAYRRQVSPPDRTTAAWVPKRLATSATAWLDKPGSGKVRLAGSGDSWWTLSRESGVPAHLLREANKGLTAPQPGKPVLIPLAACALDTGGGAPAPPRAAAAAVARAPAPEPAEGIAQPTLYVVRAGDTLESVARKTGVGIQELMSFNKANPRETLLPGTPLIIPGKGQPARSVQSASGDTEAGKTELNPSPKYTIIRRAGS